MLVLALYRTSSEDLCGSATSVVLRYALPLLILGDLSDDVTRALARPLTEIRTIECLQRVLEVRPRETFPMPNFGDAVESAAVVAVHTKGVVSTVTDKAADGLDGTEAEATEATETTETTGTHRFT